MTRRYWIHGKLASGKTELARLIAGPHSLILDDFREDLASQTPDLQVDGTIVIVSEKPPKNPALKRSFHLIEITRPEDLNPES